MFARTARTTAPLLLLSLLACGADEAAGPDPDPVPPVATSLEIAPDTATLAAIGDTVQLAAEVRDQDGEVMAGAPVTWSSLDAAVATASGTGLATAVSEGTARIVAAAGETADTAVLTVEQVPAALEVVPDPLYLRALGDSARLGAVVRDATGHEIEGEHVALSSVDTTVASVSGSGWVVARGNGTTMIAATLDTLADAATVTVAQMPASLEVSPDSATLVPGDTARLTATVADSNGVAIEGAAVAWSSTDEAVVAVDSAGRVDALAEGVARVTAKAGPAADTATITVEPGPAPEPSTIEVSPDTVAFSAVGDSVQLSAVVRDANGHELEGAALTWSSVDTTVASVSGSGWVVARGNGTAVIEASVGELADEAVAIVEQVAAAVQVSPDSATLAQGDTVRLAATVVDSNGVAVEGAVVVWSSADEDVATVDGSGLVTAVRGGETQVTANTGDASAEAAVSVLDQLVFQSARVGGTEIYVMNADGSGQTNLTNTAGNDFAPAWSPDGTKIAFSSLRDGNFEIYVMNADGSGQTNLTQDPGFDDGPAWSPDGTKIAFVSPRDGNAEIYAMNASDGSGLTNLTQDPGADDLPVWSPDGTKIAFRSDRTGDVEIYVMAPNGSGVTNLTQDPGGDDVRAVWSPSGMKLAFETDRDGNAEIYVMAADGSGQTNLTQDPATDHDPVWSPDGSRIAFVSDRDGSDGIYVMNADGSGLIYLTPDPGDDVNPVWSPDGTQIAFRRDLDGNWHVCLVNADGSGQVVRLSSNAASSDRYPDWRPRP